MTHPRTLLATALLIGTAIPACVALGAQSTPPGAQRVSEQPGDSLPLPADPSILRGELANGLRFVILPVAPDEDGESSVALLLQIAAGSAFENDDQIGAARLAAELTAQGAFTPDPDAFMKTLAGFELDPQQALRPSTSYTATRFTLALPVGAEGGLSSADLARAIELLGSTITARDFAVDEVRLTEARAELLARQTAWSGPSQRITARALPDLFGDSVYGRRVPIYDQQTLEQTDGNAIASFVESWYTPRHATLIVVGPVDRDVVRRIVEKSLGSLPAGPQHHVPDLSIAPLEQGRVLVESDAGIAGDVVQLMLMQNPAPATRAAEDLQRRLAERVATQALSRRLEELARSADAATLQGGAFSNADAGGYRMSMLNVAGSRGEWERLTREAVASLNSAQELGFTPREIEAAKERVRQEIDRESSSWERRSNESRAADLATKVQRGDALSDPQQYRQVALTSLAFISRDDITRATREIYPINSMSVLVVSSESTAQPASVQTQITAARALDAGKVASAAPLPPDQPLFEPIAGEGSVTALLHDPSTRITTATLESGVTVYHRQMDSSRGRIAITAAWALPEITEDPNARAELNAISALGWQPAAAQIPSSRIAPALDRRGIRLEYTVNPESIVIEMTAPDEQFEFAMQTLHALLESPRIEPGAIDRWRIFALQDEATSQSEPARAALRAYEERVAPEFGRIAGGLELGAIERVTAESAQKRLGTVLRESSLSVVIAGDIDRARALQVSASLLSTQSAPRPRAAEQNLEPCVVTFSGPAEVRLQQPLASGTAAVVVGFQAPDAIEVADSIHLDIVASVLRDRLRDRFRRTPMSGVAIGVWSLEGEAIHGSGRFWARALVEPRYAQAAADIIRQEMDALLEGAMTQDEFDRASVALIEREKDRSRSASAWAEALARNQALSGESLRVFLERQDAAGGVTLESVHTALRKYDTPDRGFRIIVLPAESPQTE